MKVVLLVSLLLFIGGCGLIQDESKPKQESSVARPQTPIHGFELTKNLDVAFDTQTGQLCRTWDWKPTGPEPKPNEDGTWPQRAMGEFTPTCISVFHAYPTSSN